MEYYSFLLAGLASVFKTIILIIQSVEPFLFSLPQKESISIFDLSLDFKLYFQIIVAKFVNVLIEYCRYVTKV